MLDPQEQAKGGFRAHAERERERRTALAADAGTSPSGEAGDAPDGAGDAEGSPALPRPTRAPKRWR